MSFQIKVGFLSVTNFSIINKMTETHTLAEDLRNSGYQGKMYVRYFLSISCMDLGREGPYFYEIQNLSLDRGTGVTAEVKVFSNDGKKYLGLGWSLEKLLQDERTSQSMRERILGVKSKEVRPFVPMIPIDYSF